MMKISELDLGLDGDSSDHLELVRLAVQNMTARNHHLRLENWILVNFCNAFNRQSAQSFEWTRRCNSADCAAGEQPPDYLISAQPDSTAQFVEVTELLDPGRERQREYRETLDKVERFGIDFAARDLPDTPRSYEPALIEKAREVLQKKFAKRYPRGTWLIVYFNPQLMSPAGDDSHSFGARVLHRALTQLAAPGRIEQVWILTNTLRVERVHRPAFLGARPQHPRIFYFPDLTVGFISPARETSAGPRR